MTVIDGLLKMNYIILIVNLYIFLYLFYTDFDSINDIFLKFSFKSFSLTSKYLNSKFYTNKSPLVRTETKSNNNNDKKRVINLYFIQFHDAPFDRDEIDKILNILRPKYYINLDPEHPDYVIFNVCGCEILSPKYKNAIKIAYFTENQIPDFSVADYCVGNAHINFLDRYLKLPVYFLNTFSNVRYKEIEIIRDKVLINPKREKFCAAVISNNFATDGFRLRFIDELNKYKTVDMGGSVRNNVGKVKDKIKFLSGYKFSIAMENSNGDGYLTEKIAESFLAGTIPIYYGDYMADEFVNPESFVLVKGEKDLHTKIEYIKEIDNNDKLYRYMMSQRIINNYDYILKKYQEEYKAFFENIFSQEKHLARRIEFSYNPNSNKKP